MTEPTYDPRTRTVNGIQYPTLAEAMKAHAEACNDQRGYQAGDAKTERRAEREQGGQRL